jgi:hypothetical protein
VVGGLVAGGLVAGRAGTVAAASTEAVPPPWIVPTGAGVVEVGRCRTGLHVHVM